MKGKIFNAQEVQAILNRSKVMFREVCKKQPQGELEHPYVVRNMGIGRFHYPFGKIPYKIGQKIFCKESARSTYETKGGLNAEYGVTYKAGGDKSFYGEKAEPNFPNSIFKNNGELRFAPAKSMPKWASRLTLLIKEIRVERLAEISEDDAFKEGVQRTDEWTGCAYDLDFRDAFKFNWNATHKKPEEKFEASPWVWCVSFEVIKN